MIGMEGRILRSERLCCRLLEESDKPALYALLSDHPAYSGKLCISIGIVIGKDHQRRGYGSEALSLFTSYLKERFDFCFTEHFLENGASRKTILRCGYRYLETCRLFLDALDCEKDCLRYVL